MPNTHIHPITLPAPAAPSAVNPPQGRSRKAGTSSHLTNANISTTLDTNPCADLEISRSGERIARSEKKDVSQNVRKCQVKRDPPPPRNLSHCSICTKFFRNSLAPAECIAIGSVAVQGRATSFQLYNNNDKCDKMQHNAYRVSSIFPVVIVTLSLPTLTPMNTRPNAPLSPRPLR